MTVAAIWLVMSLLQLQAAAKVGFSTDRALLFICGAVLFFVLAVGFVLTGLGLMRESNRSGTHGNADGHARRTQGE